MEIKLGKRVFDIPETCPATRSPRKSTLKRQLKEHGVESFLTSDKLSRFAGCIANDLKEAAAAANRG
jgi:hypothetical protein